MRQKLAGDAVVKGGAIEVEVKDGVVTLKGRVQEQRQKSKAESLAKKVKGVKSVVNNLQIGDALASTAMPIRANRVYVIPPNADLLIEDFTLKVVTPRTNIGQGMGAFAAFTDPAGNEFGLYEEPKP